MGLSGIFGAATRSLSSYSEALAVVQENIANAATPGYARQRSILAPVVTPAGEQRLGVEISRVESLRDRLLDFQVFQARQSKSFFETKAQILEQVEAPFRLRGEGTLGAALDDFFRSFADVSVSPTDLALRRSVLSAGDSLATALRNTFRELDRRRFDLDTEARVAVERVNKLSERIAAIAQQRQPAAAERPNASQEARLHQALDELAELIDFTLVHQSDGTLSVIGGNGVQLVVGTEFRTLSVSGTQQRLAIADEDGTDVTASLRSERGSLGALLEARNEVLPDFLHELNRFAKSIAQQVNEQLARGADLNGGPGQPLFSFAESAVTGSGRIPGLTGAATPSPPDTITVEFAGGVNASVTTTLDTFFVASAPPTTPAAGDTASVTLTSADGSIVRTITTAPLPGGETAAALAARMNDQIALDPELAGLISFSDAGNGHLKVQLSDQAGRGFDFTASTSTPAFSTGLEAGGTLGGESAEEIAAALNAALAAEEALDPALAAAGVRFAAVGGELKIDGDTEFDFTVTEVPGGTVDANGAPTDTGFASGLPLTGTAGGAQAAATLTLNTITPTEIAAGSTANPGGNENALDLAALAEQPLIDGLTFSDSHSLLISRIGELSQGVTTQAQTREQILITAENLRDGFSGVDLNEEAVNLVQFERAFQAVMRVVQVVDDLTQEVINLV